MSSKSAEDLFGLGPLTPRSLAKPKDGASPSIDHKTRKSLDARLINKEMQKSMVIMEAYQTKTHYGMETIAETYTYSSKLFNDTAETIMLVSKLSKDGEHEVYSEAYSDRLTKMAARHLYGLLEICAAQIAREVLESPLQAEAESQGFLTRFFNSY